MLYRIAQEALNNVLRHSKATKAKISLEHTETCAKLVISDNGRGFDLSANSDGIGLVGMRERVRAVGGDFRIFSTAEIGTEIHASIPLTMPVKELNTRQATAGSFS